MKQIAVLGLGRCGESLAMALMAMGNQVLGIDIDEDKVSAVEEELTQPDGSILLRLRRQYNAYPCGDYLA